MSISRTLGRSLLGLACASLLASHASALSLSLSPASAGGPGPFAFDLVVAGLGAGAAPSVGAFDVTLGYDVAILQAGTVSFGPDLGVGAQVVQGASADGAAGTWNAFSVSLLDTASLHALQGESVVLATFEFQRVGIAGTQVEIQSQLVSNASQPATALQFESVTGASVDAIPEPTGAAAMLVGILVLRRALVRAR